MSDLKLRNAADDEHADNLIKLPFLNEPAILHCLQERYKSGLIYTYTGPILIAVNPFKRVNLYTKSILDEYYNKGLMKSMGADVGTELSPHVYAIADNAYRQMMGAIVRGVDKSGTEVKCNQSILISGESGAGKTESTKVVLSYLTTVGRGLDSGDSLQGSIMEKILQSNPILEAFGNAKTKRNDNSSRFGKFIQLNFNRRGNLIGGSIKTYLLEKVRLPLQQSGERNFHIFYQLVSGSTEEQKLRRGLRRLEEFNYTSKSGVFQLTNVNDGEEYESLCGALHTLNFDPEDQILMFDIVAGILHLGQLWFQSFTDGEGEGSVLDPNPENEKAMALCTTLLGLSKEQLLESLTVKQIVAAGETYYKKLTKVQAADARDALSKAMYGKMFDWIVKTINIRIEVEASNIRANIGVLDIFGFESFAINSFEQLCINYANEALQQQFNQFIFKLEQTEYEKEKIEWSFIHFPDNKDCLDLIEHRINGLIAMLDDECRLPKASDEKFAARMYKDYATNPRFGATAPQKRSGKFSINHYAGMVEYTVATFVEKNKDELPKEANSLLQSSSNRLLGSLFRPDVVSATVDPDLTVLPPGKRKSVGVSERKAQPSAAVLSVGSQFKDQLGALMTTIYSTSPHYIRCLKPNDQNVADNFTRLRITEQLRYGGVLEAVRVARSGFPVRLAHEEFYRRYKMLVHARLPEAPTCYKSYCGDFVSAINTIVSSTERQSKLERYSFDFRGSIGMDGFQVGLTKLFLRKECHDFLETSRYRCVHFGAVQLQSFYRSCRYRSWFKNAKYAVRLIQRMYRGSVARRIAQNIRHTKAALTIQSLVRCYITRKRFTNFLFAVTILQSHARRRILSRAFDQIRRERAAKKIAKNLRMVVQRRSYWKLRRAIVKLQGKQRIVHAKHLLRKLRTEAKDLGKLQENNETLKREIEELKARAAEERVRMEQEFVRKAQENLLASNKAELEQFKTRVVELEELLRTEAKLREEAETRVQVLPPPPPEPSPALCYKCRSKIDEDGSPHSPAPHEVAPHRRNSRRSSAGDMRASLPPLGDIHSPVRAQNGVAALTPAKMAHLEDYKQANELLQAEVSRLRGTNIEHLSAIENLKRELQRAKEDEDRLRVELAKKRPLDHIAARQRRGSARFMKDATERPGAPLAAAPEPKSEIVELPVPAPTSSWISNWDAEDDDTSESGSVQDGQSLAASSGSLNNVASHASIASVETAALQSVEKNLEKWKMELVKVCTAHCLLIPFLFIAKGCFAFTVHIGSESYSVGRSKGHTSGCDRETGHCRHLHPILERSAKVLLTIACFSRFLGLPRPFIALSDVHLACLTIASTFCL